MRVISGIRKGHKLRAPKDMNTRPTSDRVKESLFNILGPIHKDSRVLDLFAGTGSVGIEFLSRGAKTCDFVDLSKSSIEVLEDNLIKTKLNKSSSIHRTDALKALNLFISRNSIFDYIFLDPPFIEEDLLKQVLIKIGENLLLSEEGIIIAEHDRGIELESNILNLIKYDSRNYGSKELTFYKRI